MPGPQDFPTDCFLLDDNGERYIYNQFQTNSPSVEIAIFPTRGSGDYACKAPTGSTCPPVDYSKTGVGRAQPPGLK
ncbi:Uncharacterised protein [Candidatus Gugararchaeum adminiculabundum]|nr:Uncharacterised protein [Candidatus Gugararchaeum adminiculabundum]